MDGFITRHVHDRRSVDVLVEAPFYLFFVIKDDVEVAFGCRRRLIVGPLDSANKFKVKTDIRNAQNKRIGITNKYSSMLVLYFYSMQRKFALPG